MQSLELGHLPCTARAGLPQISMAVSNLVQLVSSCGWNSHQQLQSQHSPGVWD